MTGLSAERQFVFDYSSDDLLTHKKLAFQEATYFGK